MEDLAWLGMAGMQRDFRQRILGLKVRVEVLGLRVAS
jgi:hypothetical protein